MDEPHILLVNGYQVMKRDEDGAFYVYDDHIPLDGPFDTESDAVEAAKIMPSKLPMTK